jgi:two-component system phosphate regulon sensor histidine kinase PhoR
MKKPIFIKIFLGYLLVILALAGLILIVSFQTLRSHYLETYTNNLKSLGIPILQTTSSLIEQGKIQELESRVSELGEKLQTRITIIDRQGTVLVDSQEKGELFESHKNRPEVISALEGNTGTSIRFSTTLKQDMLYVALPIQMRGEINAVLRLSLPLQDIEDLLDKIRKNIMESASIILGISLIIALLFSQVFSMPVRTINRASKKVASGDFKARVSLHSNDEIGELAESFNDMTEKLEASFTELSERKEELESIISSISEILLVLDREGKILLFNDGAAKISNLINLTGRYYWEVIRSSQLSRMVGKVDKGPIHGDVQLGRKSYLCSITPVESGKAKVVLLHDITEMKQMEQIKKDLVVNVSHELRTPLTAIKGFTETLIDDSDEKSIEYLNIILKHTDRLINIVSDLLNLSELEERAHDIKEEDVDIMALIDKVIILFEQRASRKNLELKIEKPSSPAIIQADPFRLEQLLNNLIDNAIKYTEKGTITISVEINPDTVSIKVCDTGIGIPKEHIPRIFERFYVADKSRSRNLGGTGLGLAIAKHIAQLHCGDVTVSSETYQGTTFTVTLPLKHLP